MPNDPERPPSTPPDLVDDGPARSVEEPEAPTAPSSPKRPPRRRTASLLFLAFGALVAAYLGTMGPQDQHVRIVLGARASDVTSVELRYVTKDGDVTRSTHFDYPHGAAPRVVSHDPQLPNGEYRIEIDVELRPLTDGGAPLDARDGRRAIQRQVTLGGGSTQVDVANALAKPAGE